MIEMMGMQGVNALLIGLEDSAKVFAPKLIVALLILALGYVIGKIVGIVIDKICRGIKLDKYIRTKELKLSYLFKLAGEWIIYLVFIQSAVQLLEIIPLATFVDRIIYFIMGAVGAAIVVVVGYILGGFLEDQIRKTEGVYKDLIGKIINFFVIYVAIAMALPILGIDPSLTNNILLIIIGSVGIGCAIALGLGLKDVVAREADKYLGSLEKYPRKKK